MGISTYLALTAVFLVMCFASRYDIVRRADAALIIAVCSVLCLLYDVPHQPFYAPLDVYWAQYFGRYWWRHRNDDDDWRGKRFKAWLRSKLPRPVVRVLRVPA